MPRGRDFYLLFSFKGYLGILQSQNGLLLSPGSTYDFKSAIFPTHLS